MCLFVSPPPAKPAAAACRTVLCVIAALLASLSSGAAQTPPADGPGMSDILHTLHLKAKVPPAADFVTRSRPATAPDFIPVGTPHPTRPLAVMTPAEVAAATADLDAARARQQRRAGQRPVPVPLKPAKDTAEGAKNTVR